MSMWKDTFLQANDLYITAMKGGESIGFRAGMLRAAEMCVEKAKVHDAYLPESYHEILQDTALIATRGRRDECLNLAYEIKEALKDFHDDKGEERIMASQTVAGDLDPVGRPLKAGA